jgi:hypothetical protein
MRPRHRAIALLGAALVLAGCGSQETSSGFIAEPIESSVTINEVFVDNKDPGVPLRNYVHNCNGDYAPWIELYNAGTEDAYLGGYWMSNDSDVPKSELPDEVVVPAGGVFLLWADAARCEDSSEVHLNFSLWWSSPAKAVLFDFEKKWLDGMWVPPRQQGEEREAQARCPDGTGAPIGTGLMTPGETNESYCP